MDNEQQPVVQLQGPKRRVCAPCNGDGTRICVDCDGEGSITYDEALEQTIVKVRLALLERDRRLDVLIENLNPADPVRILSELKKEREANRKMLKDLDR